MDRCPSNPISKLNNLAQKNHWRPPLYEIIDECGLDHDKEFVCAVNVDRFCIEGTGKRKNIAKHNAAAAMLTLVEAEQAKSAEIAENSNVDDEAGSSIYGYYDCTIPRFSRSFSSIEADFCVLQIIQCKARHTFFRKLVSGTLNMFFRILQESKVSWSLTMIYLDSASQGNINVSSSWSPRRNFFWIIMNQVIPETLPMIMQPRTCWITFKWSHRAQPGVQFTVTFEITM